MNKMVEILQKVEREQNRKNNPHYIGNNQYLVKYRKHEGDKSFVFKGVCENFNSSGLSAFWDENNEQMLLVHYRDILGLYPIKKSK